MSFIIKINQYFLQFKNHAVVTRIKLFRLNMSDSLVLLLNLVLINFGFLQYLSGRFILVEVEQKKTTINQSGTIKRIMVFELKDNYIYH